jgi:hypothetical protein
LGVYTVNPLMDHSLKHFTKCILWGLKSVYHSETEYMVGDTLHWVTSYDRVTFSNIWSQIELS